jgi:cbb3-type cytochrome oxidase maturation protein
VNLLGLIVISLALGLLTWLAFLWSVRSGQYEDPEGPKYRMLDDEDEAPPRPLGTPPQAPPTTAPGEVAPDADPAAEGVRARSHGQTPGRP